MHSANEILDVAAVGARDCIGPPDHLQTGRRLRHPNDGWSERNSALQRGEPLFVEVPRPFVLRAILEIVPEDQSALRIEVRPVLRHETQHVRCREDSMFDLGASGQRGESHTFFAMCVHERA